MKHRAKWKANPRRIIWRCGEQQIPVVMQFKLDGRKEEGEGDGGHRERSGGNLISPSERRMSDVAGGERGSAPASHSLSPSLFFLAAAVLCQPSTPRHLGEEKPATSRTKTQQQHICRKEKKIKENNKFKKKPQTDRLGLRQEMQIVTAGGGVRVEGEGL